ncbi:MAG: hypothetical protein Q7S89_03395 [bacterium]|nr:hypothetical protein [bacterium]
MNTRIPMNSAALKKAFPDIYRDFFSQNSIVCSAPRSLTWFGEHVNQHEGLTLRQQIPLRTYVGITPRSNGMVRIVNVRTFDTHTQTFHDNVSADDYKKNKIEKELLPFLTALCGAHEGDGFDISILAELPLERSVGSIGSLYVPLIITCLLHYDRLSPADVTGWRERPIPELISDPHTKFDITFRTIWKWEALQFPLPSATNPFTSLVPSATPILYSSKYDLSTSPSSHMRRATLDINELEAIDRAQYWGARLGDLFPNPVGWPFPFDCGLITTGENRSVLDTIFSLGELEDEVVEATKKMQTLVEPLFTATPSEARPAFARFFNTDDREDLWRKYTSALHMLSFQKFVAIHEIFTRGFTQKMLTTLCDVMNKTQAILYPLNFSTRTMERILHTFKKYAEEKTDSHMIAAKMNSTSQRGNILFVTPSLTIRPWIDDIITLLQKEVNPRVNLDYASWLDGYEMEGGVKIEQYLDLGMYSPHLEPDAIACMHVAANGMRTASVTSRADAIAIGADIQFDAVNEKILVAGKPVTSKELPSQSAAVAVFTALIDAPGGKVHNGQLPPSSYQSYRNELQGKIIGPLVKLVHERTGKTLNVSIEGKLTDFWVYCDTKGLDTAVIRRLT